MGCTQENPLLCGRHPRTNRTIAFVLHKNSDKVSMWLWHNLLQNYKFSYATQFRKLHFSWFANVLFTSSLGRVRRPCRGQEKVFPPVLQRCYGCSFDAQKIVHTGPGMLFFLFSFLAFFAKEKNGSKTTARAKEEREKKEESALGGTQRNSWKKEPHSRH